MSNDGVDRTRRRLIMVTSGLGAVGAAFAATPFVLSMTPSARAKAAGAPVEVDISQMELEKLLPRSYAKENLKAIQLGYDLNLYED